MTLRGRQFGQFCFGKFIQGPLGIAPCAAIISGASDEADAPGTRSGILVRKAIEDLRRRAPRPGEPIN